MNNMKDFLMFIAVGVLMSLLFSSGQVENPDTHLRLTQTRILLDNGSFKLPSDVGEDSHGNVAINKFGERCMVYNPGQSLVFIPFYLTSKILTDNSVDSYYLTAFFVSFINYIINAISAFFLFRIIIALGYARKKALITAFIFCFTSYSFIFAQSTYEHHFEMLFILVALYLSLANNVKYNYLYAGLIISIGLIFRSTTIFLAPTILLLLKTNKERVIFLSGIVPGIVILLFYNYYRFQNPLETGYSIAWIHTHGKEMVIWSIKDMPKAILGFFLSPGKGLLFFSPTIILAIFYSRRFYLKNIKFTNSILVFILLYILLFSMNFAWDGSIWSFGPRYILPITPLLYIPIAELKFNKWVYSIIILAFTAQVLVISVNYKRAVLEQYVLHDGIDEDSYVFDMKNIPIFIQSKQLHHVLNKNIKGNLVNYQPNTPWKKEIRLGTNQDILNNSIEKNSINFWWIRVFHWKTKAFYKIITLLILTATLIFSFKTYFYVKKNL
jgi:hypothetical protein